MRTNKVDNASSSLKEFVFKTEKKEDVDSQSELSDSLESISKKAQKEIQKPLPLKFFACGRAGHFAAQCPYTEQNDDDYQFEKQYKKKIFNPKKKFNFNNFKKKKSLLCKEDSDDESDDSLGDEGETLFMAEIDPSKTIDIKIVSKSNSQPDSKNCEINLEGELLCALQEIKKLEKLISSQEKSLDNLTISFQSELDDSKRVIENLISVISDKEWEILIVKQQINSLKNQVEDHERNIRLHNMLGKQKQLTNTGEYSNFVGQNIKTDNMEHLFGKKWNNFRFNPFFNGYCFLCNRFGHKVSTCKFMVPRPSSFGRNQYFGFPKTIRCFKCNAISHTSNECRQNKSSTRKVWKLKQVNNIEQSMLVQITFLSSKKTLWVVDGGCSNHMT